MITEHQVHFQTGRRTKKELASGSKSILPTGRVPRVSKMMALAIRFDQLIREAKVKNQAELARLGHVSRARLTQIMMLLQLAPDIQEALLYLPLVEKGGNEVLEREVRKVAFEITWSRQRRSWNGSPRLKGKQELQLTIADVFYNVTSIR